MRCNTSNITHNTLLIEHLIVRLRSSVDMSQLLHIDAEYKQWIQELSLRYRQSQIYNLYSSLSENRRHPADDFEMRFCNYELIHR